MKLLILFAVLAFASGALIENVAKSNLNLGWIQSGDRHLYSNYFYKAASANAIQSQDVTYRGNYNTRITAIQATEVGNNKYGNAYIIAGGIGRSNVTVRLQSARGHGFYYLVDIWGR